MILIVLCKPNIRKNDINDRDQVAFFFHFHTYIEKCKFLVFSLIQRRIITR